MKKQQEQSKQKNRKLAKKQLKQIVGGTMGEGDGEGSLPDPK